MRLLLASVGTVALLTLPTSAHSAEAFGGVYVHDVKTPLTYSGIEGGADLMVGIRGGRIGRTPLQPYVFAALNTKGDTNYAAAGLSAKFGDQIYVRPGFGLAVHSGSTANNEIEGGRIAFGSRVLFAPEINVGARLNDRLSIEASWLHMSHATLFSRQNPGIDNFGVRLNLAL